MTRAQIDPPTRQRPLRLWPGVVIVVLQWLAWLGLPIVASGIIASYIGASGRLFGGLAVVVWWAFFSRAPRSERWGAVVFLMMVATILLASGTWTLCRIDGIIGDGAVVWSRDAASDADVEVRGWGFASLAGAGRRPSAGSQRPGDGRIPADPRGTGMLRPVVSMS